MYKDYKKAKVCDRCGNDLKMGSYAWHMPYLKKYLVLCHICYQGFKWGFFKETREELYGKLEEHMDKGIRKLMEFAEKL